MSVAAEKIIAVVLAAGSSKRFGALKQTALFRGKPLLAWASSAVRQAVADNVVLLASPTNATELLAIAEAPRFLLVNEQASDGIGSSIACAARRLGQCCDALLLTLADQPLIPSAHFEQLISTWNGQHNSIVATAFADTVGPPALFPKSCFEALAALQGDQGAQKLLTDSRFEVTTVRCDDAAFDVDKPIDLKAAP